MCVCIKGWIFLWWSNTDSESVAGHWSLGSHKELKSCSVSAGRAKKEGANSQGKRPDRGYSTQKKTQTHVTLKVLAGQMMDWRSLLRNWEHFHSLQPADICHYCKNHNKRRKAPTHCGREPVWRRSPTRRCATEPVSLYHLLRAINFWSVIHDINLIIPLPSGVGGHEVWSKALMTRPPCNSFLCPFYSAQCWVLLSTYCSADSLFETQKPWEAMWTQLEKRLAETLEKSLARKLVWQVRLKSQEDILD